MLLYHMCFLITSKNSDITITPLLKATQSCRTQFTDVVKNEVTYRDQCASKMAESKQASALKFQDEDEHSSYWR